MGQIAPSFIYMSNLWQNAYKIVRQNEPESRKKIDEAESKTY